MLNMSIKKQDSGFAIPQKAKNTKPSSTKSSLEKLRTRAKRIYEAKHLDFAFFLYPL